MGAFNKKQTNTTNLSEQNLTLTEQTDQSGGSLNFSNVAGGVSLSISETDDGAINAGRELGLAGINAVQRANADSLEILAGLASGSIDASRTIARDSAQSNAGFLQEALAGFGTLAKQNSASADDRLTKIVAIALAAVAAVVVLPALFKSGGKGALA